MHPPHVGERGNFLWLVQKHTRNTSCILLIVFAKLLSTMQLSLHDQHRRHKREISLEYLTEEKFYPLGTTDEYFEAPYEEHPITICGQTVILTNGELAAGLLSLPEKNGKSFSFIFSGITHSGKSGKCTDAAGVRPGIKSAGR